MISDPDRIQTYNRWSRNPVRYSIAPRGHLIYHVMKLNIYSILLHHSGIFPEETKLKQ